MRRGPRVVTLPLFPRSAYGAMLIFNRKILTATALFVLYLAPILSPGQIRVDTSMSPSEIVKDVLLGNGVKVRNIQYRGAKQALAHFTNGSEDPDLAEGILLTTGNAFDVVGPNRKPGTGRINSHRGDRELEMIAKGQTYDAAVLEFDFIANKDSINFFYFFASEEYNEYVNSEFNDVFAFYISGPGYKQKTNLALLPRTGWPITVNTVNNGRNRRSYIDNNFWNARGYVIEGRKEELNPVLLENFELDGMTRVLRARARVKPGEVYHIKIAIADVSDSRFDSAVFLEARSFTSDPYDVKTDPHRRKFLLAHGIDPDKVDFREEPDPEIPEVETEELPLPKYDFNNEDVAFRTAIFFDFDVRTLSAENRKKLKRAIEYFEKNPGGEIRVYGHTDNFGDRAYNLQLSRDRAGAAATFLQEKGISAQNLQQAGFAFDQPAAPNSTSQGRSRNRRVEIIVLKKNAER